MQIPMTPEEIQFMKEQYDDGPEKAAVEEVEWLRAQLKELRPFIRTVEGKDIFYRIQCMGIPV